jgi:DNA-binding NarL/FixJ family response regulator
VTTTLFLAEDHAILRLGLRALLEKEPDFSVVGEASDGLQVADQVERTRPDVLILDVAMPGLSGLDVAREVTRRVPRTRIVILSMHSAEAFLVQALRNGAAAYVLKQRSAAELIVAIREVVAGRRYLSPPLSDRAIEAYMKAQGGEVDAYEMLTTRERQVLHLAAEGLNNPAIAKRLGVSPRTAESHRARVMEKLGLRSARDLIVYAIQRGLLPETPESIESDKGRAGDDEA